MPSTPDSTLEVLDGSRAVRASVRLAGSEALHQVRLLRPLGPRGTRRRERELRLGDDRLPFEGAGFALVRAVEGGHELQVQGGMQGRVRLPGGEKLDLGQVGPAYRIPADAVIDLTVGPYAIQLCSEPPPRRLRAGRWLAFIERRDRLSQIAALAFHAVLLLLAISLPPSAHSLSRDRFNREDARVKASPPRLVRMGIWAPMQLRPATGEGRGRRAGGPEGRMGNPLAREQSGLFALEGPRNNPDPHLARRLAEQAAQSSGLLQLLGSASNGGLASLFATDDNAVGHDLDSALGGLVGNRIGAAYGVGGLGLVGTGRGGGAPDESAFVGLGALGDVGRGAGIGDGAGMGRGAGFLGSHAAGAPCCIAAGRASVVGGLDKEIIRRVVRRHINEWRYCYERELQSQPSLAGRIILSFTIGPNGQVLTARMTSSTVGNAAVEQCVAQAVRRWRFPAPRGGGIVVVSYPILVRAAGAD